MASLCRKTSLLTSSLTSKTTRYQHLATGRYGSTNICRSSQENKTSFVTSSPQTPLRLKTTTSHGKTIRTGTTTSCSPSSATSSTVSLSSHIHTALAQCLPWPTSTNATT